MREAIHLFATAQFVVFCSGVLAGTASAQAPTEVGAKPHIVVFQNERMRFTLPDDKTVQGLETHVHPKIKRNRGQKTAGAHPEQQLAGVGCEWNDSRLWASLKIFRCPVQIIWYPPNARKGL